MCGFSGFISGHITSTDKRNILTRMGRVLSNRGPDAEGLWISDDGTLGMIHRRLAVVDLSSGGQQPMLSKCGRFIIVFNGEIYNHSDLRSQLIEQGCVFMSNSDTEVLIVAIQHWGLDEALKRSIGMFAFALWDQRENRLFLARDRFGEKPLYYGWQGSSFVFASTVAPLRQHPDWQGEISEAALSQYFLHDYIPGPLSIFSNIHKLLPGTLLELVRPENGWQQNIRDYWSVLKTVDDASKKAFTGSFEEAAEELTSRLFSAVKSQMLADVPIGAFLSGGVDSSMIVALMQRLSSKPIRTFTIGFENDLYDESSYAKAISDHLGTEHTTYLLKQSDILDLIPKMPNFYDEPFADASQVPTSLVSRIARKDVTVALSGDGGDEIFGGYNRYLYLQKIRKYQQHIPLIVRQIAAKGLQSIAPSGWNSLLNLMSLHSQARNIGEKMHKLANVLAARSDYEMYKNTSTFWLDGLPLINSSNYNNTELEKIWSSGFSFQEKMMITDTLQYLPDDILAKVDRASMGFSLETRAPFLDHRVFEFIWSLPLSFRIRDGMGKAIMRNILYKHIPQNLIERPKTGFSWPLGQYLRGPLRDWAESLLTIKSLSEAGYLDPIRVRSVWEEHLSGRVNRQYELWSVLMFQAWIKN